MEQNKPLTEEYQMKAEEKYEELLSEYDTSPLEKEGLMMLWEAGKKNVTKNTIKVKKLLQKIWGV